MKNNKFKGMNVLSKKKKGLIKSGLAATVLGTTVADSFMTAQAAEDNKDNNTTNENKSAKIKIDIDSKINVLYFINHDII